MKENHGGNIYKASRDYGFEKGEIIDFSANINPLGIPEALKDIIINSVGSLENYPDPECSQLREDISEYLSVGSDFVIAGNGATEILYLLFDVLKPKNVLIPAPTFSEYEDAAKRAGTFVEYFKLEEDEGFELNIKRFIDNIQDDTDAVMLCNPNNPTSMLIKQSDMIKLIEIMDKKGVHVIIDETFIELTADGNNNSVCGYVSKYENLFIVRAFTKILAVPGLRIGYGLGNRELVSKMWEKKLPWSVSSLACSSGEILNREKEYFIKTSEWIREEKEWFYNELVKLKYFKIFKPETNFILIKILHESLNSKTIRNVLASRGVLIRDASNFKFLNDKFFRVAIKDRKSNIKLLKELNDIGAHKVK